MLRPVVFISRKMIVHECNYEIYDKELLASLIVLSGDQKIYLMIKMMNDVSINIK